MTLGRGLPVVLVSILAMSSTQCVVSEEIASQRSPATIPAPEANTPTDNTITIEIRSHDQIDIDGRTMADHSEAAIEGELKKILAAKAPKVEIKDVVVIVVSNANVPYTRIQSIMLACANAGVERMSIRQTARSPAK